MVGAEVAGPTPAEFNGLQVERWPLVSWSPSFAQARCFWNAADSQGITMQSQHATAAVGAFANDTLSAPSLTPWQANGGTVNPA